MAVDIDLSVGNSNAGNYRAFGIRNRIKHPEYWRWGSVRRSHDITAANLGGFNTELNKFTKHIKKNSSAICAQALEPVFIQSQKYCPVDTGALKASGTISSKNGSFFGNGKASISYGIDGKPYYAAIVHDVYAEHDGDEQWRYLSDAMLEKMSEVKEILRDQTSKTMGFK